MRESGLEQTRPAEVEIRPVRAPRRSALPAAPSDLEPVEQEVVELFVRLVGLLKLPRSIGELYGLLFIASQPLPMDELARRLRLSKGSASQGLALLRSFGAVRPAYVPGDRRNHYVAETELRRLIVGFAREQVAPRLEHGREQMGRIEEALRAAPPQTRKRFKARVAKLDSWQRRAARMLPVFMRLIER